MLKKEPHKRQLMCNLIFQLFSNFTMIKEISVFYIFIYINIYIALYFTVHFQAEPDFRFCHQNCQAQPQFQLSSVTALFGWDSIFFNFYPPTTPPSLAPHSLNPSQLSPSLFAFTVNKSKWALSAKRRQNHQNTLFPFRTCFDGSAFVYMTELFLLDSL